MRLLLFTTLILFCSSCQQNTSQLDNIEYTTHDVSSSIHPDSSLDKIVQPYKIKLDTKMDEVLSNTTIDLTLGKEVNTLGNFVCDATTQYLESKNLGPIDLCIMNNGGLRAPIFKGDITARHIYKLMPFDNKLILITLKGEAMQELFDLVAKRREAAGGLVLTVKDESPVNPKINGENFDFSKEYVVLTSDYLYHGGDNMTFFKKGSNYVDPNLMIRDVLLEYCKSYPNGIKVDNKPRLL